MKTRLSSRLVPADEGRAGAIAQSGAQLKQATPASIHDARAASLAQFQHQERAGNSSQAAQLKARAEMMAGGSIDTTVQRVEDDELLQGKFAVAQREEDEELLQGKFAPVQRVEDEELLQGKFAPVQRVEDEELLQGKFAPVQRVEDEELLQGKFAPVQRMDDEETLQGKFAGQPTAQLEAMPNETGMPDQLKAGIETLSGMSMDHVKVHYNSSAPAQLNAHAFAQGSEIHVAPGQEQHLPHEAWHVVQQAQGRVQQTKTMNGGVGINDDVALESEADRIGAQAAQLAPRTSAASEDRANNAERFDPAGIAQRVSNGGESVLQAKRISLAQLGRGGFTGPHAGRTWQWNTDNGIHATLVRPDDTDVTHFHVRKDSRGGVYNRIDYYEVGGVWTIGTINVPAGDALETEMKTVGTQMIAWLDSQ